MTARRSVNDAIIGVWVAVPAVGPLILGLWWAWVMVLSHKDGVPPLVFITLVGVAFAQLVSILIVIEDAWIRPLDQAELELLRNLDTDLGRRYEIRNVG